MTALIALLAKLITSSGWKTYLGAALMALIAFNTALAEAGVTFLPEAVVKIIMWLSAALVGVGLRHAIGRTETAALANGVRRFVILLAIGLFAVGAIGCCQCQKKVAVTTLGCKCCKQCDCGPMNAAGGCVCKAGNKCDTDCRCEPKKVFRLSLLPDSPPCDYNPMHDGVANGWWYGSDAGVSGWYWYHDNKIIGRTASWGGHGETWEKHTSHGGYKAEKSPWLAGAHFGVDASKVGKNERTTTSGEPKP